jgi:hypothetical protein
MGVRSSRRFAPPVAHTTQLILDTLDAVVTSPRRRALLFDVDTEEEFHEIANRCRLCRGYGSSRM